MRQIEEPWQSKLMKNKVTQLAAIITTAGGLLFYANAQADITLSDFHNFHLSATYNNWDADGSQAINGGEGYPPTLTSGPTAFEVNALGYGSGAYNFAAPIDGTAATGWALTFTISAPTAAQGTFWMNPGLDIADGTHLVHLTANNTAGGFLDYGNYTAGTYTITGNNFNDTFGGPALDLSTITAFNLELDPAAYDASQGGPGTPYDITYQNLVLTTPVPEPATVSLLALATGAFYASRRGKAGRQG
jgi:hypothetical protein